MKRCSFRRPRRTTEGTARITALRSISAIVMVLSACAVAAANSRAASDVIAVKASKLYVGDGRMFENGVVLIADGRIIQVGTDLPVPDGATVVDMGRGSVTPGLIDANARVESTNLIPASREPSPVDVPEAQSAADGKNDAAEPLPLHIGEEHDEHAPEPFAVGVRSTVLVNEQSSEVVPHTRVLDSLNLESPDFDRLVRGGVTTVYASADASSVIAARGAVVHTAGPIDKRVLVPAAAVKATIGSEPSYLGRRNTRPSRTSVSMFARRPNSRMGLVWVFRKAFYDARHRAKGEAVYGADTASREATDVLSQVLDGKVPLRIQARIQRDILTALRLADEFGLPFTLEEATEAYLCIEELQARKVPVIFGPIYETPSGVRTMGGEGRRSRYFTFRALIEAGIPTALSAQEYREEDGLARQAMYAMRFGVSLDDALSAVTRRPAQMLGLDGQIGTLEAGKRADLVVWSGAPFAATSRIVAVLIDGEIVVDRR